MNDRHRNVYKAHDHIVKCRTKEGKRIFIPRLGHVVVPSDKLLIARIRKTIYKGIREFNKWARKLCMYRVKGVSLER